MFFVFYCYSFSALRFKFLASLLRVLILISSLLLLSAAIVDALFFVVVFAVSLLLLILSAFVAVAFPAFVALLLWRLFVQQSRRVFYK